MQVGKGSFPTDWKPEDGLEWKTDLSIHKILINIPDDGDIPPLYNLLGTIEGHFVVLSRNRCKGEITLELDAHGYMFTGHLDGFDDDQIEKLQEALDAVELLAGLAAQNFIGPYHIEFHFERTYISLKR